MPNGEQVSESGEFFIPDLCATKPVFIMFVLAELMVVIYVLGESELPRFAWSTLALASLFVQWIVLLCAGLLCSARSLLARMSLPAGVLVSYCIILLVTAVSGAVAQWVFSESSYTELDLWWMLRNLMVASVVGGIALRYWYLQQQLRAREQAELNARIESLRSRIRPHFLFNTMNSIASLIGSRPREAEQVVEDLSELFRSSLVETSDEATLADELHLCKLYLRIEQLRLGERLQVRWQVDDSLLKCTMPALLLQPLVENAVYHGVARIPEGGTIGVDVRAQGDDIVVRVSNPLPAGAPPLSGGLNMALDNIRQRLAALYGDRAMLDVIPGVDRHEVELLIPRERRA